MPSINSFYDTYETLITKGLNENYREKEIYDAIYKKEFNNYLRKGIEPRLRELEIIMNFVREQIVEKAVKQFYFEKKYNQNNNTDENNDEFTGQKYIWRTENDSKVRSRHGERNGKTYIWGENDLEPGQEYNCRCHAEFIDENGNKIGLARVKYDENGNAIANELKDKEVGLSTIISNTEKIIDQHGNVIGKKESQKPTGYCGRYSGLALEAAGFDEFKIDQL